MKRAAKVISLSLIAISLAAIAWLAFSARPVSSVAAGKFDVDDTRQVQFRADPAALESLSPTELEDQLRDWLFYSVLAERGLDAETLRKTMYDLPPVRAQYLKPVAAFDFGPVRFRVVDAAGSVVVVMPEGAPNRTDLLGQVADSVRSTLGDKPKVVQVFEYRLDPVELSAHVSRKPDVTGADLFGPSYRYTEVSVRDRGGLDQFLKKIDDVVWVASPSDGLSVGGRALSQRPARRKLRLEDVAALWQSERQLSEDRERVEELDARWRDQSYLRSVVEPIQKKELEEMLKTSPIAPRRASPLTGFLGEPTPGASSVPADPGQLEIPPDLRQFLEGRQQSPGVGRDNDLLGQGGALPGLRSRRGLSPGLVPRFGGRSLADAEPATPEQQAMERIRERWRDTEYQKSKLRPIFERELAELKRALGYKGGEGLPPAGSGFSLDPAYDYERLLQVFAGLRPFLQGMVAEAKLSEVEDRIKKREEGPLLDLLYGLQKEGGERHELAVEAGRRIERAQFQHARYDGKLEGTEVGMVLFYTDLLAKLWALDYLESAPDKMGSSGHIRDFVPLLKVETSPIYSKEIAELSGTRLWFGPRDGGYAKTAAGLAFSPIATRVYAASRNTLQPGVEAEPNAESATFLGWWNDHYRQVADFEPEYHRLNQIMKWSVVIGWLNSKNSGDSLGFLREVSVQHRHWFPEWARQNRELRFRDWGRVPFFDHGYQGIETESMPRLTSKPYFTGLGISQLSGGVTLGSKPKVHARPELPMSIEPLSRRANVIEGQATAGGRAFRSLDNISYDLPTPQPGHAVSVTATAPGKLRGLDVELKRTAFETTFQRRGSEARVEVSAGGRAVGVLSIERPPGSRRVEVMYSALEFEHSRSFSRTLSRAKTAGQNPLAALTSRPDVKRVIEANGSFYVEPTKTGSPWLRITQGELETNIADATDVRFAGLGGEGKGPAQWNVAFMSPEKVEAELPKRGHLLVEGPAASPSSGTAFTLRNKGPPPPPGGKSRDLDANPPGDGGILGITGGGPRPPGPPNPRFRDGGWDGSRDRFAREVALDPEGALLFAAKNRKATLEQVDSLLETGKVEQARLEIDRLAMMFANDPDVTVRRVVAHAADRSRAAAALAARSPVTREQVPALLAAADRVWPHLSDAVARQWVDAIVRGRLGTAAGKQVRYIDEAGGELGIEMRLAGLVGEPVKADAIRAGSSRYTLAVLDTNPELGLPPMPVPGEPVTGKIRDATVARLKPDVVVDAGTGARYRRTSPASGNGGSSGGGSTTWYQKTYGDFFTNPCAESNDQERQRADACQQWLDVYLIDTRTGAGATDPDRRVVSARR